MTDPRDRHIYHITHLDNLASIIECGCLWSDARTSTDAQGHTVIGYGHIKSRRMEQPVKCHEGTTVGEYVPFYFCPRSPMLYVISQRGNELAYRGGQNQVIHLVSTVANAAKVGENRPFAFSDGNAATDFAQFSYAIDEMDALIDWRAVNAKYWSDPAVKEKKQAELLVYDWYPWREFIGIGVKDQSVKEQVDEILADAEYTPTVRAKPNWYY